MKNFKNDLSLQVLGVLVLLTLLASFVAACLHSPPLAGLCLIILLFEFVIAFYKGFWKGQHTPKILTEGTIYVYEGQDPDDGVIFLKQHIHKEYALSASVLSTNDNYTSMLAFSANTPKDVIVDSVDFDVVAVYYGILLDPSIEAGSNVIMAKNDAGKIGIIKHAA